MVFYGVVDAVYLDQWNRVKFTYLYHYFCLRRE